MNKLIINTSSSIFFTRVGLFPKLLKRFKLITTKEINNEIKEGADIGYKDAQIIEQYLNDNKIEIVEAKKTKDIIKQFKIKETDASVIALSIEQEALLATEDRQIEKICLLLEAKITNTAILIYYLWENKDIKLEQALLLLDLLVRQGYNKGIYLAIKEKIIRGK